MENQKFNQPDQFKDRISKSIVMMRQSIEGAKRDEVDPRIAKFEEFLAQVEGPVNLMERGVEKIKAGDRAIGVSELSRGITLVAEGVLGIGKRMIEDGSWQRGLRLLRLVRDLFSNLGDWQRQARASVEIGDAHLLLGDYEVARMSYLDAQRYLRKIGDEASLAVTQQKLGTLALFMYQADEAERQFKEALAFFESHGDRKRAEISRQLLQLAPDVRQEIPA